MNVCWSKETLALEVPLNNETRKHAHLIELTSIEHAVVMAVAQHRNQSPAEVIQKMIHSFLHMCEREANFDLK